jgi:acetyl-CoA C-acetyltransferase
MLLIQKKVNPFVLLFQTREVSVEVYLAASVRTPIGRFGGALKDWKASDLGSAVAVESISRARLDVNLIDEVIWGSARQAGSGPNVARQISYRAQIPETRPAFTVNQACGSGLKAIVLATQEIMLERANCILAGGVESMSNVPYYLDQARWGMRQGNSQLVDGMYRDGFFDPLSGQLMGETAENLARIYKISREESDRFAYESQKKASLAIDSGRFNSEIMELTIKSAKGDPLLSRDEHPRAGTTLESLAGLPPVFKEDGTVTAGNSSGITDGAAALMVVSEDFLKKNTMEPEARVVDYEIQGVAPEIMGIAPVPSLRALLNRQKLSLAEIDLIELNEAFAAQVIACDRELKFDMETLNVNGGAIALGHPIGCTGVRITTTLLHEMRRRGARRGIATLCVSGGMGLSLLLERP